jgi:hypothetical protein
VQTALATGNDPAVLRKLADLVENCGYKRAAMQIRAKADVFKLKPPPSAVPWPASPPDGWPPYLGWPPSAEGIPKTLPATKPGWWPEGVDYPDAKSLAAAVTREEFGEEPMFEGIGALYVGACCAACEEKEDVQTGACGCRKVLARESVETAGPDYIYPDPSQEAQRPPRRVGRQSPKRRLPPPYSWYAR